MCTSLQEKACLKKMPLSINSFTGRIKYILILQYGAFSISGVCKISPVKGHFKGAVLVAESTEEAPGPYWKLEKEEKRRREKY